MRYIEVPGHIDEHDRLILDESLDVIKPQQVKIDIWFRDDDEEYHEETKEEILEGILEGFGDCLEGRTSPVSQMWDDLRIKTTGVINEEGQLVLDEPLRPTKRQYVDVVIWFIKNRKSQAEISEDLHQKEPETSSRELIRSQR